MFREIKVSDPFDKPPKSDSNHTRLSTYVIHTNDADRLNPSIQSIKFIYQKESKHPCAINPPASATRKNHVHTHIRSRAFVKEEKKKRRRRRRRRRKKKRKKEEKTSSESLSRISGFCGARYTIRILDSFASAIHRSERIYISRPVDLFNRAQLL